MTKQHRLTPTQWESLEQYADDCVYDACFLELRARIEALEATQQPPQDKLDRLIAIDRDDPANSPVERIATDPFRALCAELLRSLEQYPVQPKRDRELTDRARAALAQPVAEGPTDEEIIQEAIKADLVYRSCDSGDAVFCSVTECYPVNQYVISLVRAAQARWGTPAIQPVPVSERLPGPEDCDGEGRCWVFDDMLGLPSWTLIKVLGKNLEPDMTWLPHHALPMPAPANNTREENLNG